ncbi:MAG: peptide chain release factor 2 [Thermosediminibacterales bacterium]|nr:peptide chain release factor 2 [Thermosediminibacterales bacterium]MDK2836193.1 peptide chain release factor 2 [Thermosediminibacterales bacterium]
MIHFDLEGKKKKINELEQKTAGADFWDDPEEAQKTIQELNSLKEKVERFNEIRNRREDLLVLVDLGLEAGEGSAEYEQVYEEVSQGVKNLVRDIEIMKISTLLDGKYDKNNCIMSLHAGAGGTEAQDWVQMLLRMYTRWAEDKGYKVETLDLLPGDEAGIKSVTLMIKGENAYGYLKAEKGVHRLVRISPFDASGRRHTSFASVDVMPEIDDDIEIEIRPEDIKVDTYRSGGAGGQHVNKTDSAVRITHIPTGIVVQCQNERSQHSNRITAMKILKARLYELYQEQQKEKIEELRGEQREIAWGSQIRSYVFHPYNMVKDHRTNVEVGNVNAVMDGDIDLFINEYLKFSKQPR